MSQATNTSLTLWTAARTAFSFLIAASMVLYSPVAAYAGPPTRTVADPTAAPPDDTDDTGGSAAAPPEVIERGPPPRNNPSPGGGLSGDEFGLGPNSCKKWPPGQRFTITVPPDAELVQLVQWMSTISCQKFIWGTKVRSGKVTILSPEKVTLQEAYAAFYASLETMGLTVEPAGSYFKIVESVNAQSLNVPLYENGTRAPDNDRFVTQLVRLQGANQSGVVDVVNKLKSEKGSVEVVGNLLIITDRGTSVRRLERIIREIDTAGVGEKIFFYQLRYADAEEVASIIRDIFGEGGSKSSGKPGSTKTTTASTTKGKSSTGSAQFSRVIVDDRTGTLIIVASEGDYQVIMRLIEQLDVRLPGGGGKIHVKKLRYADPKDVATVLQNLAGAAGSGGDKKGSGNKTATEGGVSAELFSGDIKVTADESSRSLVIVASAADFKNLERVIDELDAERKQVYLEIYLLEVSAIRKIEGGTGGHAAFPIPTSQGNGVGLITSTPSPTNSSLALSPAALQGAAGGVLGPLLTGSGQVLGTNQDIPAFGAVIQALQGLDNVNTVAEPHVYTADNEEAQLEVGQRVPTPGALSFGGGAGGVQGASAVPLQSINREDVTLNIKITPHISTDKDLTLDIELEDRDIVSIDPRLGVTTTKRRFKLEQVLAHDDQPVVIGGLLREKERENTQQVPGLGSIPILGWLFKRKTKEKTKVNLLVVMVPHVVSSPDDIRRIHQRRMEERMEFIERETNFKKKDLGPHVNFRKKSGLLATVDKEARRLEEEELLLRRAEEEMSSERITGEIGVSISTVGGDDEEFDDGSSSSSGTKTTTKGGLAPTRGKAETPVP